MSEAVSATLVETASVVLLHRVDETPSVRVGHACTETPDPAVMTVIYTTSSRSY